MSAIPRFRLRNGFALLHQSLSHILLKGDGYLYYGAALLQGN